MTATIEKFKDDHFYRFGKPVEGDNDSSCHMAWRYRPKDGKPGAFYKDYRSFTVSRSENCSMSVVGIGDYHSGENARKKKVKGKKKMNAHELFDKMPIGEKVEPEGKYLIYSGGGDRCKSMRQYLWSFSCMLGEARYLNRTLVMDLSLCLSKTYSSSGVDEEGKDFRFYFDFDHLKELAPVIDRARFWSDWNELQEKTN
ncbi:hypothetical protein PHJA_001407700 [Phtheirospermum japonicum]|uniref:Uncharacterized protein n=1 Tax=Phtheirospermum japonicum TaxID=374723 RepID=A0A830CBS2_9LAMI|nr:hypothetical protein PHJA_001407700 [Phtheirospermum japonicum]